MKTSRVREAINLLKASVEDSSVRGKRIPKPEPKRIKKAVAQAKKVQKR
jgi:hypothetical protein